MNIRHITLRSWSSITRKLIGVLIVCGLAQLVPATASAGLITIRSFEASGEAFATVTVDGVTKTQSEEFTTSSLEQRLSANARVEFPDVDPEAIRASWAVFDGYLGGVDLGTEALNYEFWDYPSDGFGLAQATMVFSVDGESAELDAGVLDFEGGDYTAARVYLRDLTTGVNIFDIDLSLGYRVDSNALLLDGHTYKVYALSYNASGGDEETYADFHFDGDVDVKVPEPGTLGLLGFGLVGMAARRRKKV